MALPQEIVPERKPRGRPRGGATAYASVSASWFAGWGMQQVLFMGLVTLVLGMPAELVGTAQLANLLPSIALALVGGAVADRVNRRRLLGVIHGAAALSALILALAIAADRLSYAGLLVYALAMGTLSAFAFPARDALLSELVRSGNMVRAVSGLTVIQFIAQAVGSVLTGLASRASWTLAAGLQASIMAAGILSLPWLVSSRPLPREDVHPRELLEGVREVAHSPILMPVWLLVAGIGLFFMGPYFVVFPLLVRDYYHGSGDQLALLYAMFPVGATVVSLWLFRSGHLPRRGLSLAGAQAAAAVTLLFISTGPPFVWTLGAGLLWGVFGGVFNNASRSVFQENAPSSHRARVLSAYTLGMFAGGAIGSPLAGVLAGQFGPLGAFRICGVAMLAFVSLVLLLSRVRHVT